MPDYAGPLEQLIQEFKRLPGIGAKSAQRLAFDLLRRGPEDARRLSQAILDVTEKLGCCSVCNNITDQDPCHFCADHSRDPHLVCVVEQPQNILNVEKTRQYRGYYHVLLGTLSPLKGIGPDQLKIKGLLERLEDGKVQEIIIATNPNTEGEATAVYLAKLLKPLGVAVSRIALGVPVGSDLEYADEVTMLKALEGRRVY
jgi:recombination protein RecR